MLRIIRLVDYEKDANHDPLLPDDKREEEIRKRNNTCFVCGSQKEEKLFVQLDGEKEIQLICWKHVSMCSVCGSVETITNTLTTDPQTEQLLCKYCVSKERKMENMEVIMWGVPDGNTTCSLCGQEGKATLSITFDGETLKPACEDCVPEGTPDRIGQRFARIVTDWMKNNTLPSFATQPYTEPPSL